MVKAQLRETWERSDRWIGKDLGVKDTTVKARREELVRDATSHFGTLPEKTLGRDGIYRNYAQKKRTKSTAEPASNAKPNPGVVPDVPDDGPAKPTLEERALLSLYPGPHRRAAYQRVKMTFWPLAPYPGPHRRAAYRDAPNIVCLLRAARPVRIEGLHT